jgi:Fic family protein
MDQETKARYIYNSNRLDGIHLAYDQTVAILSQGKDPLSEAAEFPTMDGKTVDRAAVTSHEDALLFVEKLARSGVPLSEPTLREVHRRLMEGVLLSNGAYRECTLHYKGIPPVPPEQIRERVDKFLALVNQGFDRAARKDIFAWQVHHEFIFIHPFIEGNGRTARLLQNLVRLRAGLDLEVIPFGEREKYARSIMEYGQKKAAGGSQSQRIARAGP